MTNLWHEIYQIWCVCPNMGIWFLAHNSVIFCPILMKFHIRVQKTTSYKYGFRACSGYLAKLGLIWTKYGRGCPAGTVWRLGSGTPSKVRSLVLVFWSTAISKSSFTKKYPLPPPPPPPPPLNDITEDDNGCVVCRDNNAVEIKFRDGLIDICNNDFHEKYEKFYALLRKTNVLYN